MGCAARRYSRTCDLLPPRRRLHWLLAVYASGNGRAYGGGVAGECLRAQVSPGARASVSGGHRRCARWGWLLNSGVDPASTIIGGDSAGGNLTLSLLLALRDAGGPLPAGAVVLSPWTDLTNSVPSRISNDAADDMLKAEFCAPVSEMYRAGADPQDPLVSPLFGDYAGMPPILVHVSDTEILLDDSLQMVDKARAAGVLVELEVWSRLPHVWHITAPFVPEAREAIAHIGAFVKRTLSAKPAAD